MKAQIQTTKEVEVKWIKMDLAVRYDDEDIQYDFPLRKGDIWSAIVQVDTGKIEDWPEGKSGEMYMKVCDEGSYFLLDEHGNTVDSIVSGYVPNNLVPGEYGDYVDLKINEQGIITNWPKHPSFEDFRLSEVDE